MAIISCPFFNGGTINSPADYSSHRGQDFTRVPTSAEVLAPENAIITRSEYDNSSTNSYGNWIEMRLTSGKYSGAICRVAHLATRRVSQGNTVTKGQVLGIQGTTGNSTGVHLHVELIRNGVTKPPQDFTNVPYGYFRGHTNTYSGAIRVAPFKNDGIWFMAAVNGINQLNVYKYPDKNSPNIDHYPLLNSGNTFDVIGDYNGWNKIQINTSNMGHFQGFVENKYAKPISGYGARQFEPHNVVIARTGGSKINVRQGPGTEYPNSDTYPQLAEGNKVVVFGKNLNWLEIAIIQGTTIHIGYIDEQFTIPVDGHPDDWKLLIKG